MTKKRLAVKFYEGVRRGFIPEKDGREVPAKEVVYRFWASRDGQVYWGGTMRRFNNFLTKSGITAVGSGGRPTAAELEALATLVNDGCPDVSEASES